MSEVFEGIEPMDFMTDEEYEAFEEDINRVITLLDALNERGIPYCIMDDGLVFYTQEDLEKAKEVAKELGIDDLFE
jgi:hypothetical protein